MWQRFTEGARQIVFRAQEQAVQHGTAYVTPEYLLLGMTVVENNMGLRILISAELRRHIGCPMLHGLLLCPEHDLTCSLGKSLPHLFSPYH